MNRVAIGGVVTRMMTKPKKLTSASVTAAIAAIRAAPRPFRKENRPCTNHPKDSAHTPTGQNLPIYGFHMVNAG